MSDNIFNNGLFNPKSNFDGINISDSLTSKIKGVRQSVSGFTNQMVNPIKSTISDIKSGISILKDTDRAISEKLHTFQSETIDNINGYLNALTGGKIDFQDFGKVINYKDGFKVNSDELMRIASKGLGFNISPYGDFKTALVDSFMDELNNMTGGLSGGLAFNDGGSIRINDNWDRELGENLFTFLENGSDTFNTVVNFAGCNAILNTMLYNNAKMGFVNGYRTFGEMYLFTKDYYDALVKTIDVLLINGDVNSLDEILKILDNQSRLSIISKYPNFAETIIQNFKLPKDTLPEEYDTYKNKLIDIIVKVCGDNWMNEYTSYGWVLNLGLVGRASEDSKFILQRDPNLAPLLCSVGMFQQSTIFDIFKKDFPNSVLYK